MLAFVLLRVLVDRPAEANWLTPQARVWMEERLHQERESGAKPMPAIDALRSLPVLMLAAAYFMINVRTHYIDAALKRAVADGAAQVVILGAGYDSRAYRFRQAYPQVKYFEVDLPATSVMALQLAEVLRPSPRTSKRSSRTRSATATLLPFWV